MKKRPIAALSVLIATALPSLVLAGALFTADLGGSESVPPTGSPAVGHADLYLSHSGTSIWVKLAVRDLTDAITGAHIHFGAPGENGPVVLDLGAFTDSIGVEWDDPSSQDMADLQAGRLYVNVHSDVFPAGEIRGQIGALRTSSLEAHLNGSQEVPPRGSPAVGYADVTVSANGHDMHVDLSVSKFANRITGAHIHQARVGQNGPIVFDIGTFVDTIHKDIELTTEQFINMDAGLFYLNIHSDLFPAGEIRGWIGNNSPAVLAGMAGVPSLPEIYGCPNPVCDGAVVRYRIPRSAAGVVAVFDVAGRLVRQLAGGILPVGECTVAWDGRDVMGSVVPSGTYYYVVQSDGRRATRKTIVVR